ncbi:MAG: YigZ family protein [Bacteroidetes bacterium]|nr:MAG: YigZ family protein [Bacteroidota bacterium]
MSTIPDSFHTLAAPSTGEFKDRGSKFFAYAYPICTEAEGLARLEALRKEHLKARHHCFAWRLGLDGERFRANDDGEPSGTAGKPILGQIDAAGLTDVVVIVVRYFGGTLLGTSGLIQAYRESAADALRQATIVEKIIQDHFQCTADYAIVPELINALKKLNLTIVQETYNDTGVLLEIGIRKSEAEVLLLQLKAQLWKVSTSEAQTLDWPAGIAVRSSTDTTLA